MRVLGIDPGSRHTGYGVVELSGGRLRLVTAGTVSPGDALPLPERLSIIHAELARVIRRGAPVAASVEEVYHAVNARSALVLGHARGAALVAAAAAGIEVHEYAASEIKRAVTGTGRAQKAQVGRMVAMLLGEREPPGDEHACDAIAAAICHLHRCRSPSAPAGARRFEPLPAIVGGAERTPSPANSAGFPEGVRITAAVVRPGPAGRARSSGGGR